MFRNHKLHAAVALCVFVLFWLAASTAEEKPDDSSDPAEPQPVSEPEGDSDNDSATAPTMETESTNDDSGTTSGSDQRVNIRTASVTIRSFVPEETMAAAVALVVEFGGHVHTSAKGIARMRIPLAHFDDALRAMHDIGEVVDERVVGEDITLEIVTLEARIDELEESRLRIIGMLDLATTVEESLAVEKDLRAVTEELEANQGRLRFIRQQADMAPFTITVSMKARPVAKTPRHHTPFVWVKAYGLDGLLQSNVDTSQ